MIDPVHDFSANAPLKAALDRAVNLKLQADQLILGPSQRSAQDKAGSVNRLRRNFISKRHKGNHGCTDIFTALQPFATNTNTV